MRDQTKYRDIGVCTEDQLEAQPFDDSAEHFDEEVRYGSSQMLIYQCCFGPIIAIDEGQTPKPRIRKRRKIGISYLCNGRPLLF